MTKNFRGRFEGQPVKPVKKGNDKMLTTIAATFGPYIAGRAAKAGMAAIMGALGGITGTTVGAGIPSLTTPDHAMTILGYLAVGVATGFVNWATVYFKANRGY